MKEIKLNEIKVENYKGILGEKVVPIAPVNTFISGKNACGKTTLWDAWNDVLTGKTADGKAVTGVRPHDADGNDIDRIPVVRSITCLLNGKPTEIEKITEQKWKKARGEDEEYFAGNETRFRVNGFDKKPKDYEAFIQTELGDPETLLMCLSAAPFLNVMAKSTTEARKLVEKLAGDFSLEKFIEEHPGYADVLNITQVNSIEDTIKQLKRNLASQHKDVDRRKTELSYEKTRDAGNDNKIEILEEEYKVILQRQEELDKQIAMLDSSSADEIKAKLSQIRAEMAAFQAEETADYYKQLKALEAKKAGLNTKVNDLSIEINDIGFAVENITNKRDLTRKSLLSLYEQYKDIESGLLIGGKCPVCGSEIKTETEELKERNKDIRTRLAGIQKKIDDYEEHMKRSAVDFENQTALQSAKREERDRIKAEVWNVGSEIEFLVKPDITKDVQYMELEDLAEQYEAKLAAQADMADRKRNLETQKLELIAKKAQNRAMLENEKGLQEEKDNRLVRLERDLRNEVQRCADIERDIDRVLAFSIAKNKALADKINPHFRHFHFEFLEYTQEGTPVETCKLVCNGTSYFGGLNGGDKKLVEIYLVAGLQELNDLCLPIWIDEANVVDPERVPNDLKQQLIVINRSDDENITVKGA